MERSGDHGREVRDTIFKYGLSGVAATMLAVTIFSPAGFGGLVGASFASGSGHDPGNADDPYASLPAYPSPLSAHELSDIRADLARMTASLEITRAATEARIEHLESIAVSDGMVSFSVAPSSDIAQMDSSLRLTLSEPAARPVAVTMSAAPQPVAAVAPTPAPMQAITPVSFAVAEPGLELGSPFAASSGELGELLLTHELL